MSPSADSHLAATVRDVSDATIRDDAPLPRTLMQLPATLAARYRIVQPLPAAGGEADLLLVEAVVDGQQYVIKIYRYGIVVKPEVLAKISAAAPEQVIWLVEYGQADGHGYEVLEYVPEGSLRQRLAAGPLAEEQIRALVRELSAALAVLHQHDILHRDIKPENVLIRQWEPLRMALTDFGIASVAEATQHFTTTARTLRYAAPEAATGVIGMAADYWSLGIVVLEAVSGRHPFAGLSEAVLSYQLVTQPVDCSAVAEPWRTLCRGLLLRDPKQRWGRAEIERWLAGDESLQVAIEATPAGTAARNYRPYKFQGVACWTAHELAVELARHWDEGVKDLQQGFILPWLRDELRDQDLARFLMELTGDKKFSEDERLLRLIIKLAPDLPPIYKGISLGKSDLVMLALKATQGNPQNSLYLKELYERKILSVFPEHGETIDHKKIQSAWIEAVEIYEEGWRVIIQKGAPARLKPEVQVVLSGLLLINISEDFSEHLRKETMRNITDYALGCEWFMVLDHPDKAKLPHLLVLKLLTQEADHLVREAEQKLVKDIQDFKSEFSVLLQEKENNIASHLLRIEQTLYKKEYSLIPNAAYQLLDIHQQAIMDKPTKIFSQAKTEEAKQRKVFPPDFKKAIDIYQQAEVAGHPDATNSISELSKLQESYSFTLTEAISNEVSKINYDPFYLIKDMEENRSGCSFLFLVLVQIFVLLPISIYLSSKLSVVGFFFLGLLLLTWLGPPIKYFILILIKIISGFINYFQAKKRWLELNKNIQKKMTSKN